MDCEVEREEQQQAATEGQRTKEFVGAAIHLSTARSHAGVPTLAADKD